MTNKKITFSMQELKEIYKNALERLNNEMVLNESLKYQLATNTLEKHDMIYKRLEMQLNAFLNELDNPNLSTLEIERINAKIDNITDEQFNLIDELMNV
ncbi:hypothetical protein [Mammaliicoccus sciuri]|uniref:hypothetical protein n=1 Tax=Mammaliicoccus sciuri TaxID=1296 RepID=UPI002B262ACA|nr:hypothetical protein [Mammaliicoccus sciuri]WQK75170.1 hypothetical protein P3U33_05430 [Mammaliicoccus sciuri]